MYAISKGTYTGGRRTNVSTKRLCEKLLKQLSTCAAEGHRRKMTDPHDPSSFLHVIIQVVSGRTYLNTDSGTIMSHALKI